MKFYKDQNGFDIPATAVSKIDKKKDAITRQMAGKASKLNDQLKAFKADLKEKCDALFNEMLAKHDLKPDGKGNYTLFSYDRSIKLEATISNSLQFDDNITLAQMKINEFIEEELIGSKDSIRKLANHAFSRTKGSLDMKRVLSLKGVEITESKWLEAMALIDKSIVINKSKRYFQIFERNEEGEYKPIGLNFASL